MKPSGWIGVDLDGTLAHYTKWEGDTVIGDPIPKMLSRVKRWRKEGKEVRIFTARASSEAKNVKVRIKAVQDWCREHIGEVLPVTCEKDLNMIALWDDRCVQVISNTGLRADTKLDVKSKTP